ncbi:MAG: hypothetical protein M1833_001095 [Piccolia ochrophora]|nr:MAG: hypothetical protein M1833_001095 [Piccolia ochrophora]
MAALVAAFFMLFGPFSLLNRIQNDSSSTLFATEAKKAGLKETLISKVAAAFLHEACNYANGSVFEWDDFYRVPQGTFNAPAGALLKVQQAVDTSTYTLPPTTMLSRIMYQSKTLNGSLVPASAYVLWPYKPRTPDYPVVGFAHGGSGIEGSCAPSNFKSLWQHFEAPFTMSLQGYVVVAPDYAGLGVSADSAARRISHAFLASPSHAHDLFYAIEAAHPVDGYLGAVAAAPVTRFLEAPVHANPLLAILIVWLTPAVSAIFLDFDPAAVLTSTAIRRSAILSHHSGCNAPSFLLLYGVELLRAGWARNPHLRAYQVLTATGGKPVAGPLLVLQGEADPVMLESVTARAVNTTCDHFPNSRFEYVTYAGVSHDPVLFAAQPRWLAWIADRFDAKPVAPGCRSERVVAGTPEGIFQKELNWLIKDPTEAYQLV